MKTFLKFALGVLAFALWWGYGIYGDYTWADELVEEYKAAGWTLVYEQDNFASITSPWTLIKTPVTGYWFVKDESIGRYEKGNEIYLAMIAHLQYDYDDIIKEYSVEFFDAINKKSAIASMEQVKEKDLEHLQWKKNWHTYEKGQPGYAIISYVLRKLE